MTEIDYYENVRQKLSLGRFVTPKHDKIIELLKIFWDEETIEILNHFPNAGELITVKELVEKTGKPKSEIKKLLRIAAKKRTIAKVGRGYGLAPLLPGVFEAYYVAQQDSEENLKKAAKLYRYIFENALVSRAREEIKDKERGFFEFTPLLPYEAKERLIRIDETVDSESQILSYELVEEMINRNEAYAVIPCQCRIIGELTGKPCRVPSEMGCFAVGLLAKAFADMGIGRALTKEEAIEFIKETEKEGLVHNVTAATVSDNMIICNCCNCHCGALLPMKKFQIKSVRQSNFAPKNDPELCVLCENCLKICPVEAISHSSDDKMITNYDMCIGCGLCASNCPENAIKMEKVRTKTRKQSDQQTEEVRFAELFSGLLTGN
ncbi:MAG: ATP-binding protein [Candidatus Hodarchaeota archaeon]